MFTNNDELKTIAESFRDWGRDCYCPPGKDNTCGKRFCQQLGELPHGYDHKYTYSHLGYNLKITDMQAACGLAQGRDVPTTVVPFILRNVALLGVDSVMAPRALRQTAWDRLARDLDSAKLESMVEEISLDQAVEKAQALMAGQVRGRIVVKI